MKSVSNIILVTALAVFMLPPTVVSETAVIVHPENTNAFSTHEIADIFLGKTSRFSNGEAAHPYNQKADSIARHEFETHFFHMSRTRLKKYWAELIYSGRGLPPHEVEGDLAVKEWVANSIDAIGYVDYGAVDDSVKIIYTIQVFSGR